MGTDLQQGGCHWAGVERPCDGGGGGGGAEAPRPSGGGLRSFRVPQIVAGLHSACDFGFGGGFTLQLNPLHPNPKP